MDFSEFMGSVEAQLTKLVAESSRAPSTLVEHAKAFSAAVDWSESWIRCLLAFHAACLLTALLFRKHLRVQSLLFLIISLLVFLSEHVNTLCQQNWKSFAKQDYFDKQGVFAGIMYSGPLLFVSFVQLVNMLYVASIELIKVKRMELRQQKINASIEGKPGGTSDIASKKEK